MFLKELILCVIFLKISTAAHPSQPNADKMRPSDDFDFSSEEITNNPTYDQKNQNTNVSNLKKLPEKPQEHVSNLLNEVGSSLPQKVYKKIYNEFTRTKICWKTLIYVRDNSLVKGGRFPWREFEVVFDFPDKDNSKNIEDNDDEILIYKVKDPDSGTVELLNFTVIERNATSTLSKNEKITCGTGSFLTKTYFEWPRSHKKRIVVRLGDQSNGPHDGKEEYDLIRQNLGEQDGPVPFNNPGNFQRNGLDDNNDIIVTHALEKKDPRSEAYTDREDARIGNISDISTKESKSNFFPNRALNNVEPNGQRGKIKNNINDTKATKERRDQHQDDFKDLAVGASIPSGIDQSVENDNNYDDIFVVPEAKVHRDATATSKGTAPTVDPCSPILTALLTENGILPGLCTIRKNEKVVLKGDITVSKKYFNKENTEVVEPLFTILENTEIRAVPGKLE